MVYVLKIVSIWNGGYLLDDGVVVMCIYVRLCVVCVDYVLVIIFGYDKYEFKWEVKIYYEIKLIILLFLYLWFVLLVMFFIFNGWVLINNKVFFLFCRWMVFFGYLGWFYVLLLSGL